MNEITLNTQPEIIFHDLGQEFDDNLDISTLDVINRDIIHEKNDPKQWTLDDVVCTTDYSKVLSIKGMSTERNSGLTVTKLRTFCSVIPGLPKGYSNANKDALLTMLANRAKGKVVMGDFISKICVSKLNVLCERCVALQRNKLNRSAAGEHHWILHDSKTNWKHLSDEQTKLRVANIRARNRDITSRFYEKIDYLSNTLAELSNDLYEQLTQVTKGIHDHLLRTIMVKMEASQNSKQSKTQNHKNVCLCF